MISNMCNAKCECVLLGISHYTIFNYMYILCMFTCEYKCVIYCCVISPVICLLGYQSEKGMELGGVTEI